MTTVLEFACKYQCRYLVERAITFHPQIADRVWNTRVLWDSALQTAAGKVGITGICLNPLLQYKGTMETTQTFLHELAHMMQYFAYGKWDHGATWWEMMHQLGQKPTRCHTFNFAEVSKQLGAGAVAAFTGGK